MSRTTDAAIDEMNGRRGETNPQWSDGEILSMIEEATRKVRGTVGFVPAAQGQRVQRVRDLRPHWPRLRLEAHTFDDKVRLRELRALGRRFLAARIGCHSDASGRMPGRGYWLWARWDDAGDSTRLTSLALADAGGGEKEPRMDTNGHEGVTT